MFLFVASEFMLPFSGTDVEFVLRMPMLFETHTLEIRL